MPRSSPGSACCRRWHGRWRSAQAEAIALSERGARLARMFSTLTRSLRVVLQIGVIASGAMLVITGNVSAGTIIAASVLTGRLLLPFEQTATGWKQWLEAREILRRLRDVTSSGVTARSLDPGGDRHRAAGRRAAGLRSAGGRAAGAAEYQLQPRKRQHDGRHRPVGCRQDDAVAPDHGDRAAQHGRACISTDRAPMPMSAASFGRAVGYLPQEPTLLTGSVRDNIARFGDGADGGRGARRAGRGRARDDRRPAAWLCDPAGQRRLSAERRPAPAGGARPGAVRRAAG